MDSSMIIHILVGLGVILVCFALIWATHKLLHRNTSKPRGLSARVWWIESKSSVLIFAFFFVHEVLSIYKLITKQSKNENPYALLIILIAGSVASIMLVIWAAVVEKRRKA